MHRRSRNSLPLWGAALVAAAWAVPASAQVVTRNVNPPCAILFDNTGTSIRIQAAGTVPISSCHGTTPSYDRNTFVVCVDGKFEIGAGQSAGDFPDALNLIPLTSSDEPHLCEPFIQTVVNDNGKKKVVTTFLQPNIFPDGIPSYNLDAQDLDGDGMMDDQIPLGTLVTVVLNAIPDPVSGKCIGVRTTIQHRTGTCKLWITRKFYNTCSTPKRISHVKEMVGPRNCGIAGATAGPGKSTVAVHRSNGKLLSLATANTGAKVTAGSVHFFGTFFQESESCLTTASFTTQQVSGPADCRILELFLDYTPGGVLLKRAGAPGSEKLLTYHLDIE